MKRIHCFLIVILFVFLVFHIPALADAPPDPGGDPGGSGTPVGGGSPIGGGLLTMMIAGLLYGIRKVARSYKSGE